MLDVQRKSLYIVGFHKYIVFIMVIGSHYPVKKALIAASNSNKFLSWHCHITRTFHPILSSSIKFSVSRALFRCNFGYQKFLLDSGGAPLLQSCMCQKQPCTKMAFFLPAKTISGEPGSDFTCSLYLYPMAKINFLTFISGVVFWFRTRRIIQLRFSGDALSVIEKSLYLNL